MQSTHTLGRSRCAARASYLIAAAIASLPFAAIAQGQVRTWASPLDGAWHEPASWGGDVPNATGESAVINQPGAYTVSIYTNDVLDAVLLNAADARLVVLGAHGNRTFSPSSLHVQAGTLEMTTQGTNWFTHLNVAGTLTNGGTIVSNHGTGGDRTITAGAFENMASGVFRTNTSFNLSANTTNAGRIEIADGHRLYLQPGKTFTNIGSGFIGATAGAAGTGFFDGNSVTFDYQSGTIALPVLLHGATPTLRTTVANGAGAKFHMYGGGAKLETNLSPGTFLEVRSEGTHANLTVASGTTNFGQVQLRSYHTNWNGQITVGADGTGSWTNVGTINTEVGTGGARQINAGTLTNTSSGELLINATATLNADVTSTGAIRVADGMGLYVAPGRALRVTGGSIDYPVGHTGSAFVELNNGTFELSGSGGINLPVYLYNASTLQTTVANGNAGRVFMRGSGTISSDLSPNLRLRIESNSFGGGNITPTVASGTTNRGDLTITSIHTNWNAGLKAGSTGTGTWTNAGIVRLEPGAGGGRLITAGLLNNAQGGAIGVNTPSQIDANVLNDGDIVVASGSTLYLGGHAAGVTRDFTQSDTGKLRVVGAAGNGNVGMGAGTFKFEGGVVSTLVDFIVPGGALHTTTLDGGGANFRFASNGSLVGQKLSANTNLTVLGNSGSGHVDVTVANNYTNYGNITLISQGTNWRERLVSGGILNNAGVINIDAGTGGDREIVVNFSPTGSLYNQSGGAINVNHPLLVSGNLLNVGAINVAAGRSLSTSAGSIIASYGSITGGNGALIYLNGGAFRQQAGRVNVPVVLVGSNPVLGAAIDTLNLGGAQYYFDANGTIESNVGRAVTVNVRGNSGTGHRVVKMVDGAQNRGIIRLSTIGTNWNSILQIGEDGLGTLSNRGKIYSSIGAGGYRGIHGHKLVNWSEGTIRVYHDLVVNANLENYGYIAVESGKTLWVGAGYDYLAAGRVYLYPGARLVAPTPPATATPATTNAAYGLASGATASLPTAGFAGTKAGVALAGTARVDLSAAAAGATQVQVAQGARLVGNDGGTLVAAGGLNLVAAGGLNLVGSNFGSGGLAALEPMLDDMTFIGGVGTIRAASVTIQPGALLRPGDLVTMPTASSIADDDEPSNEQLDFDLAPVAGIGTLTIDGNFALAGGMLLAGVSPSGGDRVTVTGNASISGTLRFADVTADQMPALLSSFTLLTAVGPGGISGGFTDIVNYALSDDLRMAQVGPVTFKLTYAGDANVDGVVGFDDLLALAQHYGTAGDWADGDFDYTDTVDFDDLLTLAQHYGQGALRELPPDVSAQFAADWALAQSMVPEPASLLSLAMLATLRRRR